MKCSTDSPLQVVLRILQMGKIRSGIDILPEIFGWRVVIATGTTETINTPGVKQYPITIECKVLYSQDQDLTKIPEDIREKMYPQDVDGTYPMANRDFHTMYVGEIMDAYIIR